MGDFKNDQRAGRGKIPAKPVGKFVYNNGDIYEGSWKEDAKSGVGELRCVNGNRYVGEWEKNLRHGSGKCVLRCRRVSVLQW